MEGIVLESLELMMLGMGTVFFVLALFFVIVKGLQIIFPYKKDKVQR